MSKHQLRRWLGAGAAISTLACLTVAWEPGLPALAAPGTTVALGASFVWQLSGDGRFALYDAPLNGVTQVYVRDQLTGASTLVSVATNGQPSAAGASAEAISADGGTVAFWSNSHDLVPRGTGTGGQLYLRVLRRGATSLITVTPDNSPSIGSVSGAALSADGSVVAFTSTAKDLVPEALTGFEAVYVRDRRTGITQLAGLPTDLTLSPSISADGRLVAFNTVSGSSRLTVWDRSNGVRRDASGAYIQAGSISADGQYVVFESQYGIWRRELATNGLERVDVTLSGEPALGHSTQPSISADGRFILFSSGATSLVAGTTPGVQNVYVRDLLSRVTTLISVRPDGTPEPDLAGGSSAARMSGDGRTVVFSSGATDLVPGAGAGWFLRKILSPGPLLSVGSVAIREGNSGRRLVWVPVVLSEPSAVPVTVAYATQDGTAAAPSDYAPASGTLTFAPGVTQQFAPVTVVGDLAAEQDETVHVRLSAPTVATLLVGSATLTIRDDDASAASTPGIAVGDVTADEGDREVHWLLVPVTLSVPSSTPVTVSYSTKDVSGLAGRDYTATSGTLTFPPGKTSLSVVVNVHTDSIVQGDRSFQLALSGASGEPIVHAAGTVRILDDDGPLAAGPPWQLARSIR